MTMRNTDSDKMFDGLLVQRYLDGDRKALELLIKRWNKRVLAYAYRTTNDTESAQDIVQDVWLVAIKRMHRLQEHSKVGSWLLSIAHNKCMDTIRQSKKNREVLKAQIMPPIEEKKKNDDQLIALRKAIRTLSDAHQIVLHLFYLEGMSLIEISEILNLSKGTVKSRLFHAREKLKKQIQNIKASR